jgi:hypothetical protein
MQSRAFLLLGLLACAAAHAGGCDRAFRQSLAPYAQVVNALRPDKPGVARVYASDGSYFTDAETLWMKAQLRAVESACAHGDAAEAEKRLADLRGLLKAQSSG